MRKAKRFRPAVLVAGMIFSAGSAHVATRAYTFLANVGHVPQSTFGPLANESHAGTREGDSITINIFQQPLSTVQREVSETEKHPLLRKKSVHKGNASALGGGISDYFVKS